VRYIRKNARVDNLGSQQRAGSARIGRTVYLTLLGAFLFSLGYYLVGGMFVLSLDGTVVKDLQAVDASYPGKITQVFVKEGDPVEPGTPLMRIESFDMVKEIADLALRDGELSVRQGQLQGKLSSIDAIMPLAERAERETGYTLARFDKVSGKGVVSALSKDDAVKGSLQAAERVANLLSERMSTTSELTLLEQSRSRSADSLATLNAIYDDGNVRAAAAGTIGAKVPVPGQVVRFGDQLMQINGGRTYILAYLPDSYLFSIREGMAVNVRSGGETAQGRIDKILGVAAALPDEFQNMFRPRDRSRLVRVSLPDDVSFAVSQKVSISGCAFGFCWAYGLD
jgi:multidrug resistance efflux pump